MEIDMKFLVIVIIASLGFVSCAKKETDSNKLCQSFYRLNEAKHFDALYDVKIGYSRTKSIYDKFLRRNRIIFMDFDVYDNDTEEYVSMPIFVKNATLIQKKAAFDRISKNAKNLLKKKFGKSTSNSMLSIYVTYINDIWNCYDQIETPKELWSENIQIEGNPSLGKFITFTLNTKSRCFYVKDETSLTQYWLKFFKQSGKFDDHWYYSTKG